MLLGRLVLFYCCIAPLLVQGFQLSSSSRRDDSAAAKFQRASSFSCHASKLNDRGVLLFQDTTTTGTVDSSINGNDDEDNNKADGLVAVVVVNGKKRLPSIQQVAASRPARRMNHGFRHLYRHGFLEERRGEGTPDNDDDDPMAYLMNAGNFTMEQVVRMNETFPMLLQLSVPRQLYPKMMFLQRTLQVANPASIIFNPLPPQYFGARLERTLAPRHAFLVWLGLPSGQALFHTTAGVRGRSRTSRGPTMTTTTTLFDEFMRAGRNANQFAALCETWLRRRRDDAAARRQRPGVDDGPPLTNNNNTMDGPVTARHIEAFDLLFGRGLLAAARNFELGQTKWAEELWPTLTPAAMTRLLIQHGANPNERDHRGATLLHWACGSGHWEVATELLPYCSIWDDQSRDSSTPLHWAAAGATAREFGVGGHVDVCRALLALAAAAESSSSVSTERQRHPGRGSVQDYVNRVTKDGNSALMWAAWSGTLDTVKLLARHRADPTIANHNGCTVAHWATSGGNLEVCKYLAETFQVDFTIPNHAGNTPLSHAVAFGRDDVVQWLLENPSLQVTREDEVMALSLAQDFVQWTKGSDKGRTKVLNLFFQEDDDGDELIDTMDGFLL